MSKPLKILFVASEMSPLVGTGGLAEVVAALPLALRERGHDVRVALPCYRQIAPAWRGESRGMCIANMGEHVEYGAWHETEGPGGVPVYLVEHEGYFGRPQPYGTREFEYVDNAERFCFFSLAVLDLIPQTGWRPDVVHCHDWHSAAFPIFKKTRFSADSFWEEVPVVFTIHNIAFQGRYGAEMLARTGLDPALYTRGDLEFYGDMNLMKGALLMADRVSTVSPRYAQEIQTGEYGEGLDGVLRHRPDGIWGILNGVDYHVWNPAHDGFLPYVYDAENMEGKHHCKRVVQDALQLPQSDAPLFGIVSRLYWQKGIDLLAAALPMLEERDFQIAILGTGDPAIEGALLELQARHPARVAVQLKYDTRMAHLILAGSDFTMMPSRYEPCGLGQLFGLAYGAVPIVRRTGGLADSVVDCNPVYEARGEANGISFVPKTAGALARAMDRAMALYAEPERYQAVQQRGMRQDFSWDRFSAGYEVLFESAMQAKVATAAAA